MELERCLSQHAAKDAMKMKRRQRGHARQALQIEGLVETLHDPLHGALDSGSVERLRFRLHPPTNSPASLRPLDAHCDSRRASRQRAKSVDRATHPCDVRSM